MSFAPIVFPDLQELVLSKYAMKDQIKAKLKKACLIATAEYGKIRERKSMMPEIVALTEAIGEAMAT